MLQSNRILVQCNGSDILSCSFVGGRFPNFISIHIERELDLLRIENSKVSTLECLHKCSDQNVNTLDILLTIQVRLHVLHGILSGVLSKFQLGEV